MRKWTIIIVAALFTASGVFVLGRDIYLQTRELKTIQLQTVAGRFYKNPLGVNGIGDPFILKASDSRYYLYATSEAYGFRVWSSDNMVDWRDEGEAYAMKQESWGASNFWAPEVIEHNGKYYMYYTATWIDNGSLRLGVAVSNTPKGPFSDVYNRPLFDFGYAAIDGDVLIDDNGKAYLYFSKDCSENIIDGNHISQIYGVELNSDLVSVKGEPVLLTTPDQKWEKQSGPGWYWNEGPAVFKRGGEYYLMYSGNYYADRSYSVGYATSKVPLGPFKKYENNPILAAEWDKVSGTGHSNFTFTKDEKELFMVYHTHTDPNAGGGDRQLNIDRMGFRKDGSIYVDGPTLTWQPMPSSKGGLSNIAPEARVSVSSSRTGYKKEAINDGEIGLYKKFENNEWAADTGEKEPWVRLEWDKPRKISSVLIYHSSDPGKGPRLGKLIFSNGKEADDIAMPKDPGAAAIINFDEMDASWVKFICKESAGEEKGLSEIMVLGK